MYRSAMRSILSELARQNRLVVVEEFSLDVPKTKVLVAKLSDLTLREVLILTEDIDENLRLAARNLYRVEACDVRNLDPVKLIKFEKVLITVSAVKKLEEMLV